MWRDKRWLQEIFTLPRKLSNITYFFYAISNGITMNLIILPVGKTQTYDAEFSQIHFSILQMSINLYLDIMSIRVIHT